MNDDHRDRRRARVIEPLLQDIRYGLTLVARDPRFAAVVIGVLALGIGANTAMFSLVDAVLLKPLPFPEPERIVRLWEAPTATSRNGIAALNFVDWTRQSRSFEYLAAESIVRAAVQAGGEPVPVSGKLVSADYFNVFGVAAKTGRTFVRGEDQPGAAPVVILSHGAWQTRFGGDPRLLNSRLLIDGEPHTVVGILPPGSFDREAAEFWKPLVFTPEQLTRDYHWLRAVARLAPGVDLATARHEMRQIGAETARLSPPAKKDWSASVEPFDARLVDNGLRQSLYVAFGAVVLVLLIACANVSNLLLARGVARRKEIAVRAALGASRGRLIRQLLTEVGVLGLLGGLAGAGLAFLLVNGVAPYLTPILPATASVELDLRALAFATSVVLAVALIMGLVPAIRTSSIALTEVLRQAGRGNSSASSERLRRVIVSGEIALSLVLISGAALMFKTLFQLQLVNTGSRTENVITASIDLPEPSYSTPERATQFYDAVVERLNAAPGVVRTAVSTDVPLDGVNQGTSLTLPGFDNAVGVAYKRVDPDYFQALDIALVAGRRVDRRDRDGAPRVLVINEALARRLREIGVREPLGQAVRMKSFYYVRKGSEVVDWTIVGVIRDERVGDLRGPVNPVAYVALAQVPTRGIKLVVRTAGEPALAMPGIRDAVRGLDPNLPLGDVRTMVQIKQESLADTRQPAQIVGSFAAVAGLLTALGLYGVLAQVVAQRQREIGIRMALGARPRDVLSLVLRNTLRIVVAGLVLGLVGVYALSHVIQGLLFQVSALDPSTIVLTCAAMGLIALLAAAIPARRASRVNPLTVLREDG
jgi:putative ABC transport system permease protein